jgi:hypothetical protein
MHGMVMVSSVQAQVSRCSASPTDDTAVVTAVVVMIILTRTPSNDDLLAQHAVPRNTNARVQDSTNAQ